MKAAIESISGVIRVWHDGCVYGDPYEWVATVRWINRKTVEILGYTSRVTPSIWRAVIKECQKNGIDASHLVGLLEEAGFSVEARFHWFGLTRLTDRLIGARFFPRGWAPLLSIKAGKKA